MKFRNLLSSVSLGALALGVVEASVRAQEQLPTIDVGAPRVVQTTGDGAGAGWDIGAGGFGAAGPAQDPFNTSYVLRDASVGTNTDTPVMDTPLNVQSVTHQTLQDQQATDLLTALQNVAGVSLSDSSSDNGNPYDAIIMRGFRLANIYSSGFRLDSWGGIGGAGYGGEQFANVASIEVLKGPGAMLYGLNEPGGVVNFVTKEPLNAPYYAVSQEVGSQALYRTTVDATGPLTADKSWLYRMNMSYQNDGGAFGFQVDNIHNSNIFLAPTIKWSYDEDSWIKLETTYSQNRSGTFFPNDPQINGSLLTIPRNLNYGESSPQSGNSIYNLLTWKRQLGPDWSIQQKIGFLRTTTDSVDVLSTYFCSFPPCNPSPPYLAYARGFYENQYRVTQYGTYVDLTGRAETSGLEHTLLLGGDFEKSTYYSSYAGGPFGSPVDVAYPLTPGYPYLPPVINSQELTSYLNTGGVYLQDQVKLPHDVFLMAGARYQYIRENGGISGSPFINYNVSYSGAPAFTTDMADTQQALSPRIGLLWRPRPWVSLYANYSEGFSANTGFVYGAGIAPPQSAHNSEAGVKFEFYEGKLRATASYFDLTKTNVPQLDTNPAHQCAGGGPNSCSVLSGEVRSKGPELDIQGTILPGWDVILNYTNQDVRITKTYPGDPTGTVGSRSPAIPRNLGNFWTTYEFADGPLSGFKIGGGVHYHGSQEPNNGNMSWLGPLVGAYATIDLLAAYRFKVGDTDMRAQLNVYNLLDKTYYVDKIFNPLNVGLSTGSASYGQQLNVRGTLTAELSSKSAPWIHAPSAPVGPYSWTGFYLGGQIGYLWGDNHGAYNFATPDGSAGTVSFYDDAQSVIFGLHGGYNRQFDHWVIGLEGSVDGVNLNKNNPTGFPDYANPAASWEGGILSPFGGQGGSIYTTVQSNIQGAIRGRVGFDWNRLLIYGAGGVAFGNFTLQSNMALDDNLGPAYASMPDRFLTRVGWTLGGGLEYAVTNNWSVRTEYRYTDFGTVNEAPTAVSGPGIAFAGGRHLDQNQIQVGFNYKFGDAGPEPAGSPATAIVLPSLSPAGPAAPRTLPPFLSSKPSDAAPKPVAPLVAVNWTGFYLGGNVGYAWGINHGGYSYVTPAGFTGYNSLAYIAPETINPTDINAQGVMVGAHFGYDHQIDHYVVGLEGGVDGTNLAKTNGTPAPDLTSATSGGVLTTLVKSQVQGTVRARAGYAFGRLMPFAAVGGAVATFTLQSDLAGQDPVGGYYAANNGQSFVRVGWTVGGGVEYAVDTHWFARAEYRYADFGNVTETPNKFSTPGVLYVGGRHLDQNQVQLGVSYKFGEDAPAPVIAKY